MGTDDRQTAGSLKDLLESEPYRFDFFQAVRLAEALRPDLIPVGHGGSNAEPAAFRAKVGLDFPASDIVAAEFPKDDSEPMRFTVSFMGLAGGSGPLPIPFTELVMQRTAARDYATRDFLDIFNNRFIAFLYRSRKKHRLALNTRPPERTECARWLRVLAGLEVREAVTEGPLLGRLLLRYSGILSHQVRSLASLQAMLADVFKVKARGEQLLGRWLVIEPRDRTRIGRKGANRRLGVDTVLGSRAWDQMGSIRLSLTLPSLSKLSEFLPTGTAFETLVRMVRVHLQQDLDVSLRLELDPGQASGARLSAASGARLGWTSWLNTGPSRSGDDPVRLRLPALQTGRAMQPEVA